MNPEVLEGIRVILHVRILDMYRADTVYWNPVDYLRAWCEIVDLWVDEQQRPANNRAQIEDLRRFLFGELSKSQSVRLAWSQWRTRAIKMISEAYQAQIDAGGR